MLSFFDILASVFGQIATGFVIVVSGATFTYPQLPHVTAAPFLRFPSTFAISLPRPAPLIIATTTESKKESPIAAAPEKPPEAPKQKPRPPAPSASAAPITPAQTTPVAASPPTSETPVTPPSPSENLGDINTKVRGALVNILCTTGGAGPLKPISGSGIIIDPRGVILTNAHVAQFMLLRDYPVKDNIDCVIRVGSPARTMYRAEMLYFPTQWMQANAHKITAENPTGTGEHDFALLRITTPTGPGTLPAAFPSVSPSMIKDIGALPVILAAYPAGFYDGGTIQSSLYVASARTNVGQVFTFKEGGGADLFSIGGTILSQKGSSGGAVVRESDAALIGLIATATQGATTAERDLRAITISHINASIVGNVGLGLSSLLQGDLAQKALLFNLNVLPTLRRTLTEALEQ